MTSPAQAPPIGAAGMARWAWRQLTSMRVALLLLLLLAVGAVPGSMLPQRGADPAAVTGYFRAHPASAPWLDRLGLFDVYAAPWFAAIYLLLFVSLVGCILPRTRRHWAAVRARPPAAPRRLDRLPASAVGASADPAVEVAEAAASLLRRGRYRVERRERPGVLEVAAERGHWRETGNLLFHLSLVVVLVAVAVGSLWGYRATVLLTPGRGFANSVIQYDSVDAGSLFDPSGLPPFTLRLDRFTMRFVQSGPQTGTPDAFVADVTVRDSPAARPRPARIEVNSPLRVDGTLVHVLNPGYAAHITVRDERGTVVFSDAVPFLPRDKNFTSSGVVKVPLPGSNAHGDIGIEGLLLPTAVLDERGPRSVSPDPLDPALFLTAYRGDLGLDGGDPQSVFRLDTSGMVQERVGGQPFRAALGLGESTRLPSGGSVTFDRLTTWVNLQVSRPVAQGWALGGVVAAVAGLILSMFVRRRRLWVRVLAEEPGRTVVQVGGLDRSPGGDLSTEVEAVLREIAGPAVREPAPARTAPAESAGSESTVSEAP